MGTEERERHATGMEPVGIELEPHITFFFHFRSQLQITVQTYVRSKTRLKYISCSIGEN